MPRAARSIGDCAQVYRGNRSTNNWVSTALIIPRLNVEWGIYGVSPVIVAVQTQSNSVKWVLHSPVLHSAIRLYNAMVFIIYVNTLVMYTAR